MEMEMEMRAGLPIIGFEDTDAFGAWLAAEPRTSKGLWLKLAKKGAAATSVRSSGYPVFGDQPLDIVDVDSAPDAL